MWRRTARSAEQAAEHAYRIAALRREARDRSREERREATEMLGIEPDLGLPHRRPRTEWHGRRPGRSWSRH